MATLSLVFNDKKVCAGGLMIVHEDALYTHHLTLEMLKMLVEQHGGKFQVECNSATDVFMLGEVGARDPEWATSVKCEKMTEQKRLSDAGSRKKRLALVTFDLIKGAYAVKQHATACRFEGAKGVPPGPSRTRGKLFSAGLVWTGGGRSGAVRGQLTGYDAYPPTGGGSGGGGGGGGGESQGWVGEGGGYADCG